MARFLEVLADTGIVTEAARTAGMSRDAAYSLCNRDPVFAAGWRAVSFVVEYGVILGILIAIIVAIVLVLLFLMMRRRKKEPSAPAPMAPAPGRYQAGPPAGGAQQVGATMACPACGMEIPAGSTTCPVCGAAV